MERLLTLTEAAQRLGRDDAYGGQWLRRELLAREARTSTRLLVRVGRGTQRPTYRVNLALLRVHCPDLFDQRDQVAKVLEGRVIAGNRLERKVDGMSDLLEEVRATVQHVHATVRLLAQRR